jgi:Domain of unknown function (DUF4833)
MRILLIRLVLLMTLSYCPQILFSQIISPADTFPVPSGNPLQLFYLQRQPNTNTIVVELNVTNNKLNLDNPVHVYWIRYTEKGQKAELNFIQRNFAFGMDTKKIADGVYDLNFVSYKKMKFRLEKSAGNIWRVFANLSNGQKMILRRVYLHINGGSFWKPNVEYIELKGNEPVTYKTVREKIIVK